MEILISADQIAEKVKNLGEQISRDYENTAPVLVCLLKGSFIFTADLMRAIPLPHTIEFLKASSYGAAAVSSGEVTTQQIALDVAGKDVLVIEDIVDTGLTLQYIMAYLAQQQPVSLRICALLNKPTARQVDIPIDYCGFTIPEVFVVGYGLDLDERYRHLPYIGIAPE